MPMGGRLLKDFKIDSGSTTITTSYVQLSATGVGQPGSAVYAFNAGSEPLMLGAGVSGSECDICLVLPGNGAFLQGVQVPAGRLAIKSMRNSQSSGVVLIDVYG